MFEAESQNCASVPRGFEQKKIRPASGGDNGGTQGGGMSQPNHPPPPSDTSGGGGGGLSSLCGKFCVSNWPRNSPHKIQSPAKLAPVAKLH